MIALMDFAKYRGVIGETIRGRGPWLVKWKSSSDAVYQQLEKYEEEMKLMEQEKDKAILESLRNKSRLREKDFNIQHNKSPVTESAWMRAQDTIGFKRTLYGHYGSASNVNPSILWPSTEELAAFREYEAVCHPKTLSQLIEDVKKKKEREKKEMADRKKEVLEKMSLNEKQIDTFNSRVRESYLKALEIRKKKDKLIADIRLKIGYDISTKDSLFQEELKKLEDEEKAMLRLKRKARREKKIVKEQTLSSQETDQKIVDSQ